MTASSSRAQSHARTGRATCSSQAAPHPPRAQPSGPSPPPAGPAPAAPSGCCRNSPTTRASRHSGSSARARQPRRGPAADRTGAACIAARTPRPSWRPRPDRSPSPWSADTQHAARPGKRSGADGCQPYGPPIAAGRSGPPRRPPRSRHRGDEQVPVVGRAGVEEQPTPLTRRARRTAGGCAGKAGSNATARAASPGSICAFGQMPREQPRVDHDAAQRGAHRQSTGQMIVGIRVEQPLVFLKQVDHALRAHRVDQRARRPP